jgi:hypothetical protein
MHGGHIAQPIVGAFMTTSLDDRHEDYATFNH